MRFFIFLLFLSFSGFLFSCSSGGQHFSSSNSTGHSAPSSGLVSNTAGSASTIPTSAFTEALPVYAFSGNAARFNIQPASVATLPAPKTEAREPKTFSDPQKVNRQTFGKALKKKFFQKNAGPGVDKVKLYGRLALASGILAFAPFVLSMSLLYAVPFAISGLIFGRLALNNRIGNYRQEGIALAKAGFMMSIVISVILFVLALAVVVGT